MGTKASKGRCHVQPQGVDGLQFDNGFVSIGWDEWTLRFKPLVDRNGSIRQVLQNDDVDYIRLGDAHLWTEFQTDDGEGFAIGSGWRFVNRVAHYLTEVPVPEGLYIQVWDEPWTEEDERFVREAITEWQSEFGVVEDEVAVEDFERWFVETYPEHRDLAEAGDLYGLIGNRFDDLDVLDVLDDCELLGDSDD